MVEVEVLLHRAAPLLLLGLATQAHALELVVTIDPAAARQAGVDPARAQEDIADAASGTLPVEGPQAFLDELANASALATAGMGVDYASNPEKFYLGATFGTATSGGTFDLAQTTDPLTGPGFAFQASSAVGVNLGLFAEDGSFLRRVVVSVNGMVATTSLGGFDLDMRNLGGHVQVKVVPGASAGGARWGGLDVTTGYDVASYSMTGADSVAVKGDDVRWDAAGTVDLGAESRTIPIELSTNARVGVLSAYVGGALDVRPVATSGGEVELAGPIVATARGEDLPIGTVDARLGLEGAPSAVAAPRFFAGVQFDVFVVKLFGHVNVAPGESYGGYAGVRIAM